MRRRWRASASPIFPALRAAASRGQRAEGALTALGVAVPAGPNRWVALEDGGLVARLGRSEFLLEDSISGSSVRRVRAALGEGAPGVYPVPRYDLALALMGPRLPQLWEQTCSFDLRDFDATAGLVVMTQMIGVTVTVLRADCGGRAALRIWCDGTFGVYFQTMLLEIARELGGGAVDVHDLHLKRSATSCRVTFQLPTGRHR